MRRLHVPPPPVCVVTLAYADTSLSAAEARVRELGARADALASKATEREEALLERASAAEAEVEEARQKTRDATRRATTMERRLRAAEARAKLDSDLAGGGGASTSLRHSRVVGTPHLPSYSQLGWPPAGAAGEAKLSSPHRQKAREYAARSENEGEGARVGEQAPMAAPPSMSVSVREAAAPKPAQGEGEGGGGDEGAQEAGVNASAIAARADEGDASMSQDAAAVASMLAQELERDLRRRRPMRAGRARGRRGGVSPPRSAGSEREAVSVAATAAADAWADMVLLQDRAKRLQESIVTRLSSQEQGTPAPAQPRLAQRAGRAALSQSVAGPAPADSRRSRRHRRRTWSDDDALGSRSHRK